MPGIEDMPGMPDIPAMPPRHISTAAGAEACITVARTLA